MVDWILLATRWRRDGTPFPNRKLINALADGDPLAYAYLGAAIAIIVFGPALWRAIHKR
jgi:hypothetical protein